MIGAHHLFQIDWQADVARLEPPISIILADTAADAITIAQIRHPGRPIVDVHPYDPDWRDHFTVKSGSRIWPSDDPADSPFDSFTCNHCGERLSVQVYGAFRIGQEPEGRVASALGEHLRCCPEIETRSRNGLDKGGA